MSTSANAAPQEPKPSNRWAVLIPAVALLVGLVLGGLVVGVALGGDDSAAAPTTEVTDAPTESAEEAPGTAVVIPDSCLELADTAERATELIRGGIGAIREFRADDILDLLDSLEDLDTLAREQTASCRGTTVTEAPLDPESTPEAPSPTATE